MQLFAIGYLVYWSALIDTSNILEIGRIFEDTNFNICIPTLQCTYVHVREAVVVCIFGVACVIGYLTSSNLWWLCTGTHPNTHVLVLYVEISTKGVEQA